jgi:hypothetical protein
MNPLHHPPNFSRFMSRREMLRQVGLGFGSWALLDLLAHDCFAANQSGVPPNPLAARTPHFPAKAKSVIFLFMQGGPSHIDTFDPKPLLSKLDGQPLPASATAGLQLQFTKMDAAFTAVNRRSKSAVNPGLKSLTTIRICRVAPTNSQWCAPVFTTRSITRPRNT